MVFGGIQKFTLIDFPDKTACTLFTIGCDFHCPYCQNRSLVIPTEYQQSISSSEVLEFLEKRKNQLDGVCISGGEPLQHDELVAFTAEVKALGYLIKLDTNGSNPQNLKRMMDSGTLDYIALDIKNSQEKYAQTIGVPGFDISPVKKSITLLQTGTVPYEFRTTVVREFHTQEDLLTIATWISGAKKYFLQQFSQSEGVISSGLSGYTDDEMRQLLSGILHILPEAELRGI